MARIREKTLKFPGLNNTYTFADEADLFDANVDCAVGEYRIYNGDLYCCTTAHTGAWDASHFKAVKIGNEVSGLKTVLNATTGNGIVEQSFPTNTFYAIGSSVTSIDVNNPAGSYRGIACAYVACQAGDVFYYTGKGASSARCYAFLSSASGENNIISRASSAGSQAGFENEKLVAPQNAVYAIFNWIVDENHLVIKNEYIITQVETLKELCPKEISVSVLTDSISSIDDNSFAYFSDITQISDIGNFPNLSSYSGIGCIIFKYIHNTSRKLLFAAMPTQCKMIIGTLNGSTILWGEDVSLQLRNAVAYIGGGKDFIYSADNTGYFVLGDDIYIVYNGILQSIPISDVITAAQSATFITYDSETGKFSGESFALLFDTDTLTVKFVKLNANNYPQVSKHIILFYHRYTSDTSGLLVDYANRKAILLANKKIVLPDYFETEAVTCMDEIEAATVGKSYVIGFLTDTHYPVGNNWSDTAATISRVNDLVHFDAIIHCGDVVHGNVAESSSKQDLRLVCSDLLNITKNTFILSGNHDDNLIYYRNNDTGFIDRDERYAIYSRMSKGDGRLSTYTNLFYDVPDCGLRVVLLDCLLDDSVYETASSWGFTSETLTWVRDVALQTQNQVVFFCHVPCTQDFDMGTSTGGVAVVNGEEMKAIINAFITGGGVVVGFFHGHTHWDNLAQAANASFKEVCTGTARYDTNTAEDFDYVATGATIPTRTKGTVTQELWDTIVIDTENRNVSMIRFGAGSNRTFSY